MKIIDIIKQSAQLLDLEEVNSLLTSANEEVEEQILQHEDIRRLLNLCALSIQELCSNYISVYTEQQIEVENNIFSLNKLSNFIRIMNVSKDNQIVKHKIVNRNIILEENGIYTIKYCSYPSINSLFDEIDFLSNFSPDVIVMSLCAYYAISHGMFNEFELFHNRYIEKAESLKCLRLFEMPLRRWEWIIKKQSH